MEGGKILDLQTMPLPAKRTTCYMCPPVEFEVAGCPKCGGSNTAWSEYQGHVWCFDCQIDYVPAHWGVLDGPVPVGVAQLIGLSFDRIEIATGNVIPFEG